MNKSSLSNNQVRAKKSLGQHFLHDKHALAAIASAGELSPEDKVIEVGPGTGNLTELLLESGAEVLAVEKDTDVLPVLAERFGDSLSLEEADVLQWEPPSSWDNYKVVANIPYYITTPIIEHFLFKVPTPPSLLVLLVQKEYALRAADHAPNASSLSVMLQSMCEVDVLRHVSKGCFTPPPKVDSSILRLRVTQDRPSSGFLKFVHQGFSQKRKKLKATLGSVLPKEEPLLAKRAQELSVEEWQYLYAQSLSSVRP